MVERIVEESDVCRFYGRNYHTTTIILCITALQGEVVGCSNPCKRICSCVAYHVAYDSGIITGYQNIFGCRKQNAVIGSIIDVVGSIA